MLEFDVNWLAVLVAVVLAQVLGFLWYGQVLFGNAWVEAQGKKMDEISDGGGGVYAFAFLSAAVMVVTLAIVLNWTAAESVADAMLASMVVWLGFVATTSALNTAFENRGWKLWAINNGYHIVNMLIASTVLSLF